MLAYLKDPYTRLKIINNTLSSVLYTATAAIIWIQFKKELNLSDLIAIDNIWAPAAVAVVMIICNKFREQIISRIILFTILYGITTLAIDGYLFFTNAYLLKNYIFQTATDIFILNIYCYSFNGFESKVFDKADSQQKFWQNVSPITTIATLFGGLLGLQLMAMSLRSIVGVQMIFDIIWTIIQLKLILIGKLKVKNSAFL